MKAEFFLEERYLETIQHLIDHNLWDIETGLILIPLIQHCMPPPSIKKMQKLIEALIACKINTDWAPKDVLKKLQVKFKALSQIGSDENFQNKDYPIWYGILRIDSLKSFSPREKSDLIIEFVETVFKRTGSASNMKTTQYYNDIYSLRDILIRDLADRNNIKLSGNLLKNFDNKEEHAFSVLNHRKRIGDPKESIRSRCCFWDDEYPFIPFSAKAKPSIKMKSVSLENDYIDSQLYETGERETQEAPFSILSNDLQHNTIQNTHSKWIRGNVRSHADANQLCMSGIFRYFEHLLSSKKDKYEPVFVVGFLSLAIGINKKRWINLTTNASEKLTDQNFYLDQANQIIRFRVSGAATDFIKTKETKSQIIILQLPTSFRLTHKIVTDGTKEDYPLRAFLNKHNGTSPSINRIARSGHTLVRKLTAGETDAFLLSGSIPIEFRARNAYKAINNDQLNESFYKNINEICHYAKSNRKEFPSVYEKLNKVSSGDHNPASTHLVGSQLTNTTFNFSRFKLPTVAKQDFNNALEKANQLEVYFFWMLQFGFATRPIASSTESHSFADYWLHRDKDSEVYQEKKLLLIPSLINSQHKEILACRDAIGEACYRYGYTLQDTKKNYTLPIQYKPPSSKKVINVKNLLAKDAQKIAESWGLTQPFKRLNAHRHQCATYMHDMLSEQHADISLGHHIDGWFFAAPEASGSFAALNEVQDAQTKWLNKLGFKLVRNPIL